MRRIFRTVSFGVVAGLFAISPVVANPEAPPNVLFIPIDDLVPTLGCYGDEVAISPRIDGLAALGTTFLNHHCQWPVCGPSRAALSTGLMPEETNVRGFRPIRAVLPDVITLPQHFRENGYETAATGKFYDPRTVGTIVDGDSPTENGSEIDDVLSWSIPYVKAASGFSPAGRPAVDSSDLPDADYGDHKILTEGLTLIDTLAAGEKPFFLAVGFKKPHLAFVAPQSQWDRYDAADFRLASFQEKPTDVTSQLSGRLDFHNELLGYEPYNVTGLPTTDAEQRELIHGYYACVSFVDSLVGQLLDKLATTADPVQAGKMMSETTIVVLWGDHGFHLGDHGRWGKHSNIERSTSCPLIIYDPRSPTQGDKTTAPANTIDIYPTLCELAGLAIPEQPLSDTQTTGRPLRGRSLVPVLADPEVSVNDGAITLISDSGAFGYSYRTERYRLIEWVNGANEVVARDLFDYVRDPLETINFANDVEYAAVVYQLSRSMRAEPALQGSTRLINSAPISTGGDAFFPGVSIGEDSVTTGALRIAWPKAGGITYEVERSSSLLPDSWSSEANQLAAASHAIVPDQEREFFRVGVGSNTPPYFVSDPVTGPDAPEGEAYAGTLANLVQENDGNDTLAFAKVAGPGWLMVASDGTLTGTPPIGSACPDYFRVSVSDDKGAVAVATLQITVVESNPTQTADFVVSDDTFSKQNNITLDAGNRDNIELRQIGNHTFARVGFFKFEVSGIGTVTEATLHFHSIDEVDPVVLYSVADTTWTENSLNWDNQPALGTALGTTTPVVNDWFSYNVTSHVTEDGTFAFALEEQGDSFQKLTSKEGGQAAFLRVTWEVAD